nr:DUF6537 domain-containing protein [Hankyongella ginsenosidimutans]
MMAYKDEYEVARLYTDGRFAQSLAQQFSGYEGLDVHLAPPLISPVNPATGRPDKQRFGGWMFTAFRILAGFKGLRGTAFDIFGRTQERRAERLLVADYEALLDDVVSRLTAERIAAAVELAELPDAIRGFGPVKEAALAKVKPRWETLVAAWRAEPQRIAA